MANERVDRLDKMIVAQDNAVDASVDLKALDTITTKWRVRETPTVRAVMVLDADQDAMEVRAFVSRRPGPEDDAFRRMLVSRLLGKMKLSEAPRAQLRHLHHAIDGKSYLISYWQRRYAGRNYLVVAWHYVQKLVLEVMPQLYRDLDNTSRMNVVDQTGQIRFGEPIPARFETVGKKFPTTLYNWRLNVALTSTEGLTQRAITQRYVQLGVVGLAMLIAIVGVFIIVRATIEERRLAMLKSEFVANVSHELKTPLASVRMFGELLLTDRVANEGKKKEYLQIIVGESERLSALIDNVLDFAKVEGGKDAYEFAPDDVAGVVSRAAEMLVYRAERQNIAINMKMNPAHAVVDARAIELALINLIDNALKYAKGSESIDVLVKQDGDQVVIRVADQGPGIALEEQERIFDRFVRGRNAQEMHTRGSGIGLALVKHIAESHGGTVRVESPLRQDGRGTAFEMRLPADEADKALLAQNSLEVA